MTARTILCIRHGESTFNAACRTATGDPLHFDAPLSPAGHEQVRQARLALRDVPVELVMVSPLTRALQTAVGLFTEHPNRPRFEVIALHRERVENSCDIGRAGHQLAVEFPMLDVAHLGNVWWHTHEAPDARGICIEPVEIVAARAAEFKALLRARQERFIAVVGHGTFFHHLTGKALANCEVTELQFADAP
jgi:broad specificity phosphatase PhoE